MAIPFVLAVLVAYMNGIPTDYTILGDTTSVADCQKKAAESIVQSMPGISKNVEVIVKCYDFGSAPISAAGFGQKR